MGIYGMHQAFSFFSKKSLWSFDDFGLWLLAQNKSQTIQFINLYIVYTYKNTYNKKDLGIK